MLLGTAAAMPCLANGPNPQEIVRRSVAAMDRNWKLAPRYAFIEHDVETSGDTRKVKTSQVLMIDGSPYYRLIAVNNHPLPPDQQAAEERKLQKAIAKRRHETPEQRQKRIAAYLKERKQDHSLMREMADAFQYRITGEEVLNGHRVWVLAATPRPGYQPKSLETRVLTGMRGTLWIDQKEFQWVKVHAEVFRPVAFGLFIAKVQPGTEFMLEQEPVGHGLWLPRHFRMREQHSILWFNRQSSDDETYRDYQPMSEVAGLGGAAAGN